MSNPIRWTVTPRRGVEHLFRFLAEDTDYGIFDIHSHPLYRRLTSPQKHELVTLMHWLKNECEKDKETGDNAVGTL